MYTHYTLKHIHSGTYECLSRQSSLVINIVGTDDISRLPRLATGLTDDGWGGGGVDEEVNLNPPPRCPVYTPQYVVMQTDRRSRHNT